MSRNDFKQELDELGVNIGKILLMVVDSERISTSAELLNKYTREFHNRIENIDTVADMEKAFGPYVNKICSVCEALGIPSSQWKPVRKLILDIVYNLKKEVLLPKMSDYKVE